MPISCVKSAINNIVQTSNHKIESQYRIADSEQTPKLPLEILFAIIQELIEDPLERNKWCVNIPDYCRNNFKLARVFWSFLDRVRKQLLHDENEREISHDLVQQVFTSLSWIHNTPPHASTSPSPFIEQLQRRGEYENTTQDFETHARTTRVTSMLGHLLSFSTLHGFLQSYNHECENSHRKP